MEPFVSLASFVVISESLMKLFCCQGFSLLSNTRSCDIPKKNSTNYNTQFELRWHGDALQHRFQKDCDPAVQIRAAASVGARVEAGVQVQQ